MILTKLVFLNLIITQNQIIFLHCFSSLEKSNWSDLYIYYPLCLSVISFNTILSYQQINAFVYNKDISPKLAYRGLKLWILFFCIYTFFFVFSEIKHQTDLDATYFKLHLTIIKFPTLEISSEWSGGFTSFLYDIFRVIYLCCKV